MKNNKSYLLKVDKPLCPWDIVSFDIKGNGQMLCVLTGVKDSVYKVNVISNKEEKLDKNNFKKGVELYKLYNITGNKKDDCKNSNSTLTLLDIR